MHKWNQIRQLGDENHAGHTQTTGKRSNLVPVTQGRFSIYNKKVTYTTDQYGRLKVVEGKEKEYGHQESED